MPTFGFGSMSLSIGHTLTDEEAANRVDRIAEDLKKDLLKEQHLTYTWDTKRTRLGFQANAAGARVNGEVRIRPRQVMVSIRGEYDIGGTRGTFKAESQVRSVVRYEVERALQETLREKQVTAPFQKRFDRIMTAVREKLDRVMESVEE